MPARSASASDWNLRGRALHRDLSFVAACGYRPESTLIERRFAGAVLAAERVNLARAQVKADLCGVRPRRGTASRYSPPSGQPDASLSFSC